MELLDALNMGEQVGCDNSQLGQTQGCKIHLSTFVFSTFVIPIFVHNYNPFNCDTWCTFGEQTNLEALRWKLSSFFARRQNWVSWPFVCNVIWNEEFVFFLQKGRNQTCPQELPKLVAGRTAHELFEPFKFQGPSNFNIVIIAQVMIGKNRSGRSLGANLFIGDWWPRRFPTHCFRCASWWRE